MGKVHAILDDWLRNEDIKLPRVERQPTAIEKKDPQYCRYHRTVDHPTKDCRSLKRIFQERIQNGELIIENNDVRRNPLPTHDV